MQYSNTEFYSTLKIKKCIIISTQKSPEFVFPQQKIIHNFFVGLTITF